MFIYYTYDNKVIKIYFMINNYLIKLINDK